MIAIQESEWLFTGETDRQLATRWPVEYLQLRYREMEVRKAPPTVLNSIRSILDRLKREVA